MGDTFQYMMDRLAIMFQVQPWIIILTLIFLIMLFIGLRYVIRHHMRDKWMPDWNRDPDELPDLAPRLRQARIHIIAVVVGIIFLLFFL